MKLLLSALLFMGITACAWANPGKAPLPVHADVITLTADSTPTAKTYHYQLFTRKDGAFGYDILSGTKKMIHQDCIPGQPGNKGFITKEAAGKVAALVVNKLQKNIFPPTVSSEELKQLHVL